MARPRQNPSLRSPLPCRRVTVTTPDGLAIAAQEWGTAAGPEIIFIHGFSQSHLCWLHQVTGPLARDFRLVTYDIRGHGGSDKPPEAAYYRQAAGWANELEAVIEQFGMTRPVVVAWSYAGRIALDYLLVFGSARLAGLVFVGATSCTDPACFGPAVPILGRMGSDDPATSILATREFLQVSTARPLPCHAFEFMLGYNMLVPARIRANLSGRPAPYEAVLTSLDRPLLAIHGEEDVVNLPAMACHTIAMVPRARGLFYDGVGHLPFWEAPGRFDADIAEFVLSVQDTAV